MLRISNQSLLNYLRKTGTIALLAHNIFPELVLKICEYVAPILEETTAPYSLVEFIRIFTRIPEENFTPVLQQNKILLQEYDIAKSNAEYTKKLDTHLLKALNSNTVTGLASFNKFLRDNNFDANDLSQKNSKGLTPLTLAKREAAEVIPFIERRTASKSLCYRYTSIAKEAALDHKEVLAASAAVIISAAAAYTMIG
jgi:hypothetical protein